MTDEPKAGSAPVEKAGEVSEEESPMQVIRDLRAELAAIKAQASAATEYVLAVNRELRARAVAQAKEDYSDLRAQLAELREAAQRVVDVRPDLWGEIAALEAILAKQKEKT